MVPCSGAKIRASGEADRSTPRCAGSQGCAGLLNPLVGSETPLPAILIGLTHPPRQPKLLENRPIADGVDASTERPTATGIRKHPVRDPTTKHRARTMTGILEGHRCRPQPWHPSKSNPPISFAIIRTLHNLPYLPGLFRFSESPSAVCPEDACWSSDASAVEKSEHQRGICG